MPSLWAMRALYALIFLSGCSGLIYQVVWHKYLAILLGAQARATAIVLAIFLGGISVGYAAFGRWTRYRRWNLLTAYALVEAGLGLWAFLFPYLFRALFPLTGHLYGILGVNNLLIDIFLSVLLIGFPTFLMGGTLPLLTQGLSKDLDEASRTHAKIYGFNTVGACLGCLFAGYLLIPMTSLPAASGVAGVINLFVAAMTYLFFARRSARQEVKGKAPALRASCRDFTPTQLAILAVGFLSGFYLITLETILIRLMGLSTGASNYNFTLIVAIFILGLGIGSLVTRNISRFGVARLFWNQVGVALCLFLLYLSCDYWSYYVHVLRAMLRDLPESFYFYQLILGLAFTGVLIVPIGLSGFTLPLCFHFMKDQKESLGERVGQLYGINTVGCVMGALVGGYALLNLIDLDQLFKVCIFLSLLTVAAAAYIYVPANNPSGLSLSTSSAAIAIVLMGLFISPRWTKERFLQPFRHPSPTEATFKGADAFGKFLSRTTEFIFWKDGPNTSIGIGASKTETGKEVSRTIVVNGKSDGNTRGDFFTTVMLAHIPGLLEKKIDRACVIGLGTGMTIGTLMQYPQNQTIDVAEISNFSIANASYFDAYDNHVSESKKVTFHEMDAFRFLEGAKDKFDVIISEPSNPWVSGIENLYSEEFYKIALDKMTDDGMFVQWIHTYSFNDDLLKMVLKTMSDNFGWVSVFQLKGGDLALVAKRQPVTREDIASAEARMRSSPLIRQALNEAGIDRIETVLALEIIPSPLPKAMGEGMPEHRLESPKLSDEAAKAFFVGNSSRVQTLRRQFKEYYGALDSSLLARWLGESMPSWAVLEALRNSFCDNSISKTNFLCEETLAMMKLAKPEFQSDPKYDEVVTNRDLASLQVFNKELPKKFTASDLQTIYSMFELYKKFASPIARVPLANFMKQVDYCMHNTVYKDELYGECLLQKILVLETVKSTAPEFFNSVNQYLDWFPNLAKDSSNFQKLEEARNILVKLVARKS